MSCARLALAPGALGGRYAQLQPIPPMTPWSPSVPTFRLVDASVLLQPTKTAPTARQIDPELAKLVKKIQTITDVSVVYEVTLEDGEKAPAVRQKLLRASKLADVEIAIRKSPKGWFVGQMTPARRSTRGRKRKAA